MRCTGASHGSDPSARAEGISDRGTTAPRPQGGRPRARRRRGTGRNDPRRCALARRPAVNPPELSRYAEEWPAPNNDISGTRAAAGSPIDAANVRHLRLAWRFRFTSQPGLSGIYASTPLVLGGRVFVQDLNSNVYALDEETGRLLWRKRFAQRDGGPNGLAAGYGRIYGNTSRAVFALDASTGALVWLQRLVHRRSAEIDIAPLVANDLVYTSTIGRPPGGRGVLYALDAATGRPRWSFDTIRGRWAVPAEAAGGGAVVALSLDERRTALCRKLESVSVGRHEPGTRTAARTAGRRSTRTPCSFSTAEAESSTGTTR